MLMKNPFWFLSGLLRGGRRRRPIIEATYDAARTTTEMSQHWANADALDADAANSLAVRKALRQRSRYEAGNNGYYKGMLRTQTNYKIGRGPRLRMQNGAFGRNIQVEARWQQWCAATGFFRKLRTMARAKDCDGEGFGVLVSNPALPGPTKLDLRLIECDRVTAPVMTALPDNYVDGIRIDDDGNPLSYDILTYHPGGTRYFVVNRAEYQTYPAKFILHWFLQDRPEQHRGIPEATSVLNLFGGGRRYREAVIAAAETVADFAAILEMGAGIEGPDEARPWTKVPIEKRMLMATPAGSVAKQMKPEQPPTTFEMFNRQQVSEQGCALNMPYNVAACDSSDYNYASGRLDHQTYFTSLDVEQAECEEAVLDPLFAAWFVEANQDNGWDLPTDSIPEHTWDWPGQPHVDPTKVSSARKENLSCGATTLSDIYAEDGFDFEDKLIVMAANYGKTVEEMREKLFEVNLSGKSAPAPPPKENPEDEAPPPSRRRSNGRADAHGRFPVLIGAEENSEP